MSDTSIHFHKVKTNAYMMLGSFKSLGTHPQYKASLSAAVAFKASTEAIVVLVNIPLVPMSMGVSVPNSTRSCPKKSIALDATNQDRVFTAHGFTSPKRHHTDGGRKEKHAGRTNHRQISFGKCTSRKAETLCHSVEQRE